MTKNVTDFVSKIRLTKQIGARVRSLLSLMFSVMLIMSNATPFVQVASAASGDFSIDFVAAAPQSYNHQTGGGAFDDGTIGVGKDVVESLEGGDFSCGDIVTFFAIVKVDGTSGTPLSDDPQTIEMNFSFTADTTGQSGAAFGDIMDVRVNYGTIEDLIPGENNTDEGNLDNGGSVATLTRETLTGPLFQKGSELQGTVELTDLQAGEQVVVRIDVKLFCNPGSNPTGNLQADLSDAKLTYINGNVPATGDISAGQQTIPLKQIGNLLTPELDIQKTVNTTDGTCPGMETLTVTSGDTVKYCYIVSNTGDAPLYNVNVIDDAGTPSNTADDFIVTLSSGLTDVDGDGDADDLAAGGTARGTALVTLSTAGTIVNNATATGNDSISLPTTLTDSDIATVIVEGVPSYTIDKIVTDVAGNGSQASVTKAGDVISYQINVTNTGNVDLTNVTVTDPLLGTLKGPVESLNNDGVLEVAETWTYTGSYKVTQEDINNNGGGDGDIDNTATVDCDQLEIQEDSETVPIQQNAAYTIEKIVTDVAGQGPTANVTKAGDVISYQITVNNTGNVDLTNVTVTDPLLGTLTGPTGDNSVTGVLEVGEKWVFTGNYTVTQIDINNNGGGDGVINNTATVDSDELPPQEDSEDVPIDQNAAYTIEKIVTDVAGQGPTANITAAGDVISYQITVNNTGNVDLTNVTVTDPLLGTLTGPTGDNPVTGVLEVGEIWTYTGTYTVTQEDINNNGIAADGSADNDGDIDNKATVDCDQLGPKDDTAEVPIDQNAAYTIEKIVTDVAGQGPTANVTKAGDVISYQITVNNTGNVDLTNVTVTDSLIALVGPIESLSSDGILEVGETWTYTGTYTVTMEDIATNGGEDGDIDNTATVNCDQLEPKSDSADVPIIPVCEPKPAYEIEKCITDVDCRGSNASVTGAGDVITYRITVTNKGDINLTNATVTDSLIALAGPMESKNKNGILEIGETWTYTGKYTVTQKDIDTDGEYDGYIDNTATVDCDQLDPKSDSVRVPIEKVPVPESCPAYKIEKCVTDVDCRGPKANVTQAGDIITYRITVTNTGNVGLTNVVVNDPLIKTLKGPVESKDANKILDAGEKWIYTGSYTVTQKDMDTNGGCDGYIDNTATVDCDQLNPKSDSARVLIEKESAEEDQIEEIKIEEKKEYCIYKSIIGVDKAGDCIINKPGDIIEYQIIVSNEGNTNLTGVSVIDPMITLVGPAGDEADQGVLNPGEAWKFVGNYTVTQEDINSNGGGDGFIDNTATVRCNELPDKSSSIRQPVVLPSNEVYNESGDDAGSDEGDGNNGGNGGGTGSARVTSKSSTNNKINENKEKETGIELEPEIKGIGPETGNAEGNAEKIPEQEESTVIPGFLIYGIIGLLAILLFALLRKRK